jgi:L-lactate dehydrogenase complex protein LldE
MSKQVALFATCIVNTMRPRVGFAALKLLEDAGYDVVVPENQTCCGQPNFNSGDREGTRQMARHFLKTFKDYDYVVVPSGSCGGMVHKHYPELFDPSEAEHAPLSALAGRTYELMSFLTGIAGVEKVSASCNRKVTYHDSCAGLRELKVKQQPRDLLNTVEGLELVEMKEPEVCCGFGGLFCVKYSDISGDMVEKKADDVVTTGADLVAMGDVGCLLNVEGRLNRRGEKIEAVHVAEVLAGMVPDRGEG